MEKMKSDKNLEKKVADRQTKMMRWRESCDIGGEMEKDSGVFLGNTKGHNTLSRKKRDRKSTRLNSSHNGQSRMPSSA